MAETSELWIPERIGVQAGSPDQGVNPAFSFHGISANDFYRKNFGLNQLLAYPDHDSMIQSYIKGELDSFCIAVDNNFSGRVVSAINALRILVHSKPVLLVGKQQTIVEQQLLTFEGLYERDIQQVMSQKPALDQLRAFKPNHSWAEFFVSDTVLAAARVARHKGRIGGVPTAAVASRQAGEGINGLKSLGKVSPPGNATTFWFFTRPELSDERHFGNPTHASFTFVITDERGSLYRVANEIADYGFSMDDIDSHIARTGDTLSFYAEVKYENGENDQRFNSLINKLKANGNSPQVLGRYVDRTSKKTRAYIKQAERVYPDVETLAWSEHANNSISEGAQVFYVRGDDRIGLLRDILAIPDHLGISVAQMSRPLDAGRGFMLIFDSNVKTEGLEGIFHQEGFIVRQMIYMNGKLV